MTAEDGARLRVVIDLDKKKNKSVINFYSNRKPETGRNMASSRMITDSDHIIAPDGGDVKFSVASPTESEAFKRWFGDSKVVDENGKPLVVYHGTGAEFTVFDRKKLGGNVALPLAELGFSFAENQAVAADYAAQAAERTGRAAVMPAYLAISNPLLIEAGSLNEIEATVEANLERSHDGIIFATGKGKVYIAFEPTQIKSATDNNGEFDPGNPDIRFSQAEYSEKQRENLADAIREFVRREPDLDNADYLAFFRNNNLEVYDERTAGMFANEAKRLNRQAADRLRRRARDDYLGKTVPFEKRRKTVPFMARKTVPFMAYCF